MPSRPFLSIVTTRFMGDRSHDLSIMPYAEELPSMNFLPCCSSRTFSPAAGIVG